MSGKQETFDTKTIRAKYADLPNAENVDGAIALAVDRNNAPFISIDGELMPLAAFNPATKQLIDPDTGNDMAMGSGTSSGVPYYVPASQIYTVPLNFQAFAPLDIEVDGDLVVEGELIIGL